MKNLSFFKATWVVVLLTLVFFVKAQVPSGIIPANGIPVLVPATVNQLMVPNGYSYLTFGNSGLQRSITNCDTLSLTNQINLEMAAINYSHEIITTSISDDNTCNPNVPGQYLYTMPVIPYWDSVNYGQLRVMRLGDDNPGSHPFASATSTYYFTPTDDQNLLFLWIAFVTQATPHHDKSDNGLFRVEMTDLNGNYVTGNYYTSTFYIIPETTSDPILHPCCQAQYIKYSCLLPPSGSSIPNMWADWRQLVFDLRPFIGQTIKLRIIVSECLYQAHYTYSYYTGFGVNGNLEVNSCALDSTSVEAPIGFEGYKWYVNNVYYPEYDSIHMITMVRNTSDTIFRCEALSQTGAPFVVDKTVNYYTLTPDFTWQQLVEGNFYKVQFTNASTLINNTNNGSVPQNVTNVLWDFGDGFSSSDLNPIHYYSGVGPYTVTLKVFDNHNLCSEEISDQVLMSGVSVNEAYSEVISYKVYPNPFKEEIILEVVNTNEIVSYEILNLLGQVVYQGKMIHQCKVQANGFQSGVYVIKFSKGDQTFYSKIVKE